MTALRADLVGGGPPTAAAVWKPRLRLFEEGRDPAEITTLLTGATVTVRLLEADRTAAASDAAPTVTADQREVRASFAAATMTTVYGALPADDTRVRILVEVTKTAELYLFEGPVVRVRADPTA